MSSIQSCRICSLNNVSQWGTWEVAREIISNAIDADPKYFLTYPDTHSFDIYTSTAPTYAECASIGESSKTYGGSTIGQFGEGLKVAAATAARLGGSIVVTTPSFRGRYLIRNEEGFRHPSLWLEIEDPSARCAPLPTKGCTISVSVPSANFQQYQSRFIPPASTLIPKPECSKATIYCKGVWIGELHYISRYDYNLDFEINRDRNVNSSSSAIYSAAYRALNANCPDDIITAMFKDTDSVEFELQCLCYAPWARTQSDTALGILLTEKAKELYGSKPAVIDPESTQDTIQEAIRQGYSPVSFHPNLFSYLPFPRVAKIKPPARSTPTNFVTPPSSISSFVRKAQSVFSSLCVPPPAIVCVSDDDSTRPLVWENDSTYYYTVGRDDSPIETFFSIYASHLSTQVSSPHAESCGWSVPLCAAAQLYRALTE